MKAAEQKEQRKVCEKSTESTKKCNEPRWRIQATAEHSLYFCLSRAHSAQKLHNSCYHGCCREGDVSLREVKSSKSIGPLSSHKWVANGGTGSCFVLSQSIHPSSWILTATSLRFQALGHSQAYLEMPAVEPGTFFLQG